MSQISITEEINASSDKVAAELLGLHSELEILHIPANLDISKFARLIPEYYSGSYSQEALGLASRLVEEKLGPVVTNVTTSAVRDVLYTAIVARQQAQFIKE